MEHEDVSFSEFIDMIEWNSRFIITLIGFQVMWMIFTIMSVWTRRFRMILVFVSAFGAFFAEKLNAILADNWYDLGLQRNIFDREGFFMFVFWAIPLVIDIFFLVLSYLRELCETMAMSLRVKAAIKAKKQK